MIHSQDLKFICKKLGGSNGVEILKRTAGASGVVDTLGFDRAILIAYHGPTTSSVLFQAKYNSTAAALFASGTAFNTAVSTTVATSGLTVWNINLPTQSVVGATSATNKGCRFIRLKCGAPATSSYTGFMVLLSRGKAIPPAALGANSVTLID